MHARYGLMVTLIAFGSCGAGCTTEDVDVPVEDTTTSNASTDSASSSTTSAGQANNASSTSGGLVCDEPACSPIVIEEAALLSFSGSDSFSGGYFSYGTGVNDEVTDEEWHISGNVSTYSGFGVSFPCVADVSAYKGIQFRIRGQAGSTFALSANTTSNSTPSCSEQHNTCSGRCANSEASVELTKDMQLVSLMWDDFSGGSPNAQPDPSEIYSLVWVFGWTESAVPYDVDVTIDDIEFIE